LHTAKNLEIVCPKHKKLPGQVEGGNIGIPVKLVNARNLANLKFYVMYRWIQKNPSEKNVLLEM
jgi:hypothetical protein